MTNLWGWVGSGYPALAPGKRRKDGARYVWGEPAKKQIPFGNDNKKSKSKNKSKSKDG